MIAIHHLDKAFGEQKLFQDFSLEIESGEFVIISGASGRGKTTLLNMVGLLEPFDNGELLIDGIQVRGAKAEREYWKNKIGFLFQNFALIENQTVRKNLEIVRADARTDYSIDEVLERVGLLHQKDKKVYSLSGGEQQRIALARLFLKKCDIILADEPTGSLDRANAQLVMQLLLALNAQGKTVLVVTHDESMTTMGKRVIEL
jgi:putative ABC transport system ATP-binding protein